MNPAPSDGSLRKAAFAGALILTIAAFSALPAPPPTPTDLPHFDKVVHLGVYGLIATAIVRAFPTSFGNLKRFLLAVLLTSGFGLTDELIQSHNPFRIFDMGDWLADIIGATLASFFYLRWKFYHELLEKKPLKR